MRYVALAIIIGSLPILMSLLRQSGSNRGWALTLIGAMFLLGDIRISSFLIGWPLWPGLARGLEVSYVDAIAVALIMTRGKAPARLPFWPIITVYAAALVISMLVSQVWVATLFSVWQFARMILLFVAIGGEVHRPEAQRGLVNGLALGLLFQAGYVVEQKLTGVVQAGGSVGHQNTLGLMVELVLLPLVAVALSGRRSWLLTAAILAGLAIVGGGGSRGTIVFAGAGIIVLGILSLARHTTSRKIQAAALGSMALAIAAPFGYLTLQERFGGQTMITREDERAGFERAAIAIADDFPFGIGSNMYVTTASTKGYNARAGVVWHTNAYSIPVHNAYLLARAETGRFGEIAFLLLLAIPMFTGFLFAFKYRRSKRAEIVLGSSVALGLNIIHNNFEFATLSATVLSLVMINLSIIAAEVRFAKFAAKKGISQRRKRRSDHSLAGAGEAEPRHQIAIPTS